MTDDKWTRESIQHKMKNIEAYMPCSDRTVRDFAAYYSEHLPEDITPYTFVYSAATLLSDLMHGQNGSLESREGNGIAGLSGIECITLMMRVPDIADSIFPERFAMRLRESYNGIVDSMNY
jgi:hypothetical protein